VEANIIYELLEKEVVPLFYDRGNDNIPYRWIEYMKASLRAFCPVFSTNRMVEEYTRMFYVPACRRSQQLAVNHLAGAKALAQWKGQVEEHWDSIRFLDIKTNLGNTVKVNAGIEFKVHLDLGGLSPDDVDVQLYYGPINAEGELIHGKSASLVGSKADEQNTYLFDGEIEFPESGRHGYTIRILPRHPDLVNPYEMGLVTWADAAE